MYASLHKPIPVVACKTDADIFYCQRHVQYGLLNHSLLANYQHVSLRK